MSERESRSEYESRFHRLFSAWMGETLGDYLRRGRIEIREKASGLFKRRWMPNLRFKINLTPYSLAGSHFSLAIAEAIVIGVALLSAPSNK